MSKTGMHIIVNALPLTGLLTGIARYVRCLYSAIQGFPDIRVTYFTGSQTRSEMPLPAETNGWMRRTEHTWKLPDAVVFGGRTLQWLNFERLLRKACRHNHFTIYHETGFVPAAIRTLPIVFTLHDLSLLDHRATHPRERVWFFNRFFKRRLAYATHIITVSEFMRREIIEKLHISPDAVTAIHEAPDAHFYPRPPQQVALMCEQHGWPRDYVLFVGTLEPRKNIAVLIDALARTKNNVALILAGWRGWGEKTWLEVIEKRGLRGRVHIVNYVSEETLACLYSGAGAFIYPSIYEGFGLPVLEAMACGCPVICSNVASMPEVAGDAALYFSPRDPDELAGRIDRVIEDSAVKSELVARGLQRATQFSWHQSAAQTVNLFASLIENHQSISAIP